MGKKNEVLFVLAPSAAVCSGKPQVQQLANSSMVGPYTAIQNDTSMQIMTRLAGNG